MQISSERLSSHLTLMEKSALLLLSGANAAPIHGKTAYQKEFLFIAENDERIKDAASFEPYLYGPHSEPAENALDVLISYGLAEELEGYFQLTERGKEIASIIKENSNDIDIEDIEDVKEFLNDVELDEILLVVYVLHPTLTTESTIKNRVFKKRLSLATSLYMKDKVGIEMAALLAGMSI